MEEISIIHYGELALKGNNRSFFEDVLINNIKAQTGLKIKREFGRLVAEGNTSKLGNVFGIANYWSCLLSKNDIEEFKIKIESLCDKDKIYRIETSRVNKNFPLKSPEVSYQVAKHLMDQGYQVSPREYNETIRIEILNNKSYLLFNKKTGAGGLPMGVTGKITCLLSGGLDSPVSIWKMMKRGATPILVHYYMQSDFSQGNKIFQLVDKLNAYSPYKLKLIAIPFGELQKEIIKNVDSKFRLLIYRRFMYRIAEKIAIANESKVLVSGDSLGQVASQTLDNIIAVNQAVTMPVFRPLLAMDKQEIIDLAIIIDTYKISIQEYADCCSFLVPDHPETRAKIHDILEYEELLNITELVDKSISNI